MRAAMRDVFIQPDEGPSYSLAWVRSDAFEGHSQVNPATLVNGITVLFDLFAFPAQETTDPDPILAINEFVKQWALEALVIGKDDLEQFQTFTMEHPTFTVGEKKTRPGVYHRYENDGGVSIAGAINGIGAGVIRANWGPLNKVVEFEPSTKVSTVYGSGNTKDLITEMFTGGLSSGFFVRVGSGGSAPTLTLNLGSGGKAGTINGAYVGDRVLTACRFKCRCGYGKSFD